MHSCNYNRTAILRHLVNFILWLMPVGTGNAEQTHADHVQSLANRRGAKRQKESAISPGVLTPLAGTRLQCPIMDEVTNLKNSVVKEMDSSARVADWTEVAGFKADGLPSAENVLQHRTRSLAARFDLGSINVSELALSTLSLDSDIDPALKLHATGTWGHLSPAEWERNNAALAVGGKLRSLFRSLEGAEFVLITDQCSGSTVVLLEKEEQDFFAHGR